MLTHAVGKEQPVDSHIPTLVKGVGGFSAGNWWRTEGRRKHLLTLALVIWISYNIVGDVNDHKLHHKWVG